VGGPRCSSMYLARGGLELGRYHGSISLKRNKKRDETMILWIEHFRKNIVDSPSELR
jgi:hypothetical protein